MTVARGGRDVNLTLEPETVPLTRTPEGVIRVGGTRVPLDTVVYAFRNGASAEAIVDRFPSLKLADVYGAITYYLRHTTEVDAYIAAREREADDLRREVEARFPQDGLRAKLLSRHAAQP
jgi:uncharacterized protein (DUF433 family)